MLLFRASVRARKPCIHIFALVSLYLFTPIFVIFLWHEFVLRYITFIDERFIFEIGKSHLSVETHRVDNSSTIRIKCEVISNRSKKHRKYQAVHIWTDIIAANNPAQKQVHTTKSQINYFGHQIRVQYFSKSTQIDKEYQIHLSRKLRKCC